MTTKRSDSVDYKTQCTVCIDYEDSGATNRLVYERPQMLVADRPLTATERALILQYPNDDALTVEAKRIFQDMKSKGRIAASAKLASIFIARSAAAALEMRL
jgi:hypothetical protein